MVWGLQQAGHCISGSGKVIRPPRLDKVCKSYKIGPETVRIFLKRCLFPIEKVWPQFCRPGFRLREHRLYWVLPLCNVHSGQICINFPGVSDQPVLHSYQKLQQLERVVGWEQYIWNNSMYWLLDAWITYFTANLIIWHYLLHSFQVVRIISYQHQLVGAVNLLAAPTCC